MYKDKCQCPFVCCGISMLINPVIVNIMVVVIVDIIVVVVADIVVVVAEMNWLNVILVMIMVAVCFNY